MYPVSKTPATSSWGTIYNTFLRNYLCVANAPLTLTLVGRLHACHTTDSYGMPLQHVELGVTPLRTSDAVALSHLAERTDRRKAAKSTNKPSPDVIWFGSDQGYSEGHEYFSVSSP